MDPVLAVCGFTTHRSAIRTRRPPGRRWPPTSWRTAWAPSRL